MNSIIVLGTFLFVLRPPRPNIILLVKEKSKETYLGLEFKLSIEQFFNFFILALVSWYWWLQIDPKPKISWEITCVIFLKLLGIFCNYLYKQDNKQIKSEEQARNTIDTQSGILVFMFSLYVILLVFGVFNSSIDTNHHPVFAAFLFSMYLFVFVAFQFDYIHLQDEI